MITVIRAHTPTGALISLSGWPQMLPRLNMTSEPERPEWRQDRPEEPLLQRADHSVPTGPPGRSVVPPREVQTAFWLWAASFALALLSVGIVYFGNTGDLSEAARIAADQHPLTFPGIDTGSLMQYIFFVGLLLFFAFKMRAGKNWARITLVILTALFWPSGVPFSIMLISLGADASFVFYVVCSSLAAGLIVAAIVFVFLPNANPYFRSARRHR